MPTRKDKTNVAPIYREQVFIPASGATLMKQKARPRFNGFPIASGAIDIVSPEFDLLTGVRGFTNMVKPKNYKSIISSNYYNPAIGELDNSVNQGIEMGRAYFNHPVVKNTLEHNRQLYKRIIGRPRNMIYIDKTGNKVLAKERGELLNNAVSKPINYKFDKLPKGEAGTYNRNADMSGNITIAEGLSPTVTKNSAFHETLHHGAYGNYDGVIYDLKAEKLFPNNAYLRAGHEAAANTAEVGRDMGLAIGQKYPGMNAFRDMLDNLPKPYYKDVVIKSAKLETPRDYKRFWDALTGKYFTTAGTTVTGLHLTNANKMKCGGIRKAQLGLDIQYGGRAIPIANNMVYFDGNSHSAGGIGVGNNLEVEGGEVGEKKGNSLRIFSAVPFLDGISPAQLVMGGANPNKVFKAQEEFKDRNRINDDGTIYQTGGQKKSNSAIRTEADKKVPAYNRAVYSLVDPTMAYPTKKEAVGYAIGAGIKAMRNPNDMVYWVTDSVSDAAWRKRHGLSYDDKFLIPNEDGSVRLPKDREMEIPTDTTMLKNRIAANKKLAKRYPEGSEKRDIVDWALRVDGMALDSLRHTYRTGEPVTINEGAYNSRRLINNGELSYPEIMPHNVMQNYAIQYDKSKDKMNYWDTYNFNQFEWGVPGKPFEIKGSVPLKKLGGSMIYTINGNVKNGLMSARPKAQYGKITKINRGSYETVDEAVERYKQLYRIKYGKEPSDADVNRIAWTKTLENSIKGDPNLITGYGPNVGVRGPNVTKIVSGANKGRQITRTKTTVKNKNVKSATPQRQAINTKVSQAARAERQSQFDAWQQGEAFKASTMPTDAVAVNRPTIGTGVRSGRKGRVDDVVAIERSQRNVDPLSSKSEFSVYDKAYAKKVNGKMNQFANALLASGTGGIIAGSMTYDDIVGDTIYDEEVPVQNNIVLNNNQTNKSVNSNIKTQNKVSNNSSVKTTNNAYVSTTKPNTGESYVINPLTGEWIRSSVTETSEPSVKGTTKVTSKPNSTPRGRVTKASTSKVASQSTPTIQDTVNKITADAWKASKTPKIDLSKVEMPKFDISRLESKKTKEDKAKLDTSSTGGGTQSKDERLIPQFKPINTGDWIGLGSNLAGHIASYFINNNLLKKYPMPTKPVPFQTAKLKTTHNINPQLTSSRETEQMNLAEVGRNTASSNTSLARKQRIMNEARDARNKLYGQKENIETQLINLDRRNRQDVYNRNIAAYNDWLDKTYVAKTNKMLDKQRNIMHMISDTPSAVNYMLGNIENRKSTNNIIHAIAAANPNVDGRLLGIGDYYIGEKTKKKYDKFSNLIG